MQWTEHATRQCESRAIPVDAVAAVIDRKVAGRTYESVAVMVGRTHDRGALVGSNGECVWAVVRDGVVATVMLRRGNQPSTRGALRVDAVLGEERRAS